MKKIFYTLTLLCAVVFANAQTNLELATESFNAKEYTVALSYYQKVLAKPAKNVDLGDVNFKAAECLRYTGKYDEAIAAYQKARAAGYSSPNAIYHEGALYFKKGDYTQAQKTLETFLEKVPGDKDATRIINSCKFVMGVNTDEKTVYTFINEASLNSEYNDYAAYPVKNQLLFTSSRITEKGQDVYSYDAQGFSSIYASSYSKDDKSWSKPAVVAALNTVINNGVLSYCEKTKTAYFTRCNDAKSKTGLCSVWETTYDEGANSWSAPKAIALSFVQKGDMSQPCISTDGDKLYFASRMEGGLGSSDIWVMSRSGSQWGEPKNLGAGVNTEFDEMFPTENNGTLYFASDGYAGYGGLDLYSTANNNGNWSKPANLKLPFNSAGDDFFIVYKPDGSGYLTSNRTGGAGGDDIYNFFLTPVNLTVKGRITDQDGNQPLAGATVYITTPDGHVDSTTTNANGEYMFTLDKDKDYKITVANPGYFGDSRKLSTQGEKFSREFSKANGNNYDFSIKRIPKTEIKIDNIYYDYDSYVLREESKPSLDILVKLLEDTPGALVQINSHTDERGKPDYNNKLSENRAKSVVEYLISKGISQGRLSSKGFGSTTPVVKGAKTEEDHQKNRRTAFQVISE